MGNHAFGRALRVLKFMERRHLPSPRKSEPNRNFAKDKMMSTGTTWTRISIALLLGSALMWTGIPGFASVADRPVQRKAKKKQAEPPPPLPSGPTGPVPPMPLDSLAAVPPQVTYQNNQLTIIAPNSTLADILRAVRKQTGAEIEIPAAPERVVTHLGPGPARDVVADLLN